MVAKPSAAVQAPLGVLLLLPMLAFGLTGETSLARQRRRLWVSALLLLAVLTSGCSNDNDSALRGTGMKTVLVTATVGTISRSVAVNVTVR